MTRQPTAREQDCLKALYHLGATTSRPVGPAEAAARLGVRPATSSAVLERLGDEGWGSREAGVGARLTQAWARRCG